MNNTIQSPVQTAFNLKASSLTFTVFQPTMIELENISEQLTTVVSNSPNFFNATPTLIDLTLVEHAATPLDLPALLSLLREHQLSPIGVRMSGDAYSAAATELGLAIINQTSATVQKTNNKNEQASTMIVDQPVRSGKQIYAKGCDLIITSTVSNGAEVLADGNIHIYGNLKGRALAGVQGDENARIFCRELDAELVAIAGNYLVNEQIPDGFKKSTDLVEVSLVAQSLRFNKFTS